MFTDPSQQVPNRPPWPVINDRSIGDNYAPGPTIKVRCIHPQGVYYNFKHRREGDVFELIPMYVTVMDPKTRKPAKENGEFKRKVVTAEEQFSETTMEKVESTLPVATTTAQAALNRAQDEKRRMKE